MSAVEIQADQFEVFIRRIDVLGDILARIDEKLDELCECQRILSGRTKK